MSDYGASLQLVKKSGPLSKADKAKIATELVAIIKNGDHCDALGDPFNPQVSEAESNTAHIILSKYWHGDGDAEENFQFGEDNDLDEASAIAEKLQAILGADYEVTGGFEEW